MGFYYFFNITSIVPGTGEQKKRRSKRDLVGRNFTCERCNKSYLSYPALYTHVKTKHVTDPLPSKSTRGRPKKPVQISTIDISNKFMAYFDTSERKGETKNGLELMKKATFAMDKLIGWGLENPDDYALIKCFKTPSERDTKGKTCDSAFAEYCCEAAKITNEKFFEKLAMVVIGYRECVNKYGWQKLFAYQGEDIKMEAKKGDSPRIDTCMDYSVKQQTQMKDEYSTVNNPDRVPEMANEFVLLYARQYDLGVAEQELISIVMNLCEWLCSKGYTSTQVSLIKGIA